MDAKEELQSCLLEKNYQNLINLEIKSLFIELNSLEDQNQTNSLSFSRINGQIERYETLIAKSEQKVEKIRSRIDGLNPPYKNVLFLRYIIGKSYEDISDSLNYSTPRVYQLHKIAIDLYDKKYFLENNLSDKSESKQL